MNRFYNIIMCYNKVLFLYDNGIWLGGGRSFNRSRAPSKKAMPLELLSFAGSVKIAQ